MVRERHTVAKNTAVTVLFFGTIIKIILNPVTDDGQGNIETARYSISSTFPVKSLARCYFCAADQTALADITYPARRIK